MSSLIYTSSLPNGDKASFARSRHDSTNHASMLVLAAPRFEKY